MKKKKRKKKKKRTDNATHRVYRERVYFHQSGRVFMYALSIVQIISAFKLPWEIESVNHPSWWIQSIQRTKCQQSIVSLKSNKHRLNHSQTNPMPFACVDVFEHLVINYHFYVIFVHALTHSVHHSVSQNVFGI